MKVKIDKACQTYLGKHKKGDSIDVSEGVATKLIERGFAKVDTGRKATNAG